MRDGLSGLLTVAVAFCVCAAFAMTILLAIISQQFDTINALEADNKRLYQEAAPIACQAQCLSLSPYPAARAGLLLPHPEDSEVSVCYCDTGHGLTPIKLGK